MIVVDSSIWIDYFNGAESVATDRLDALLGTQPVGLGDLILTEVLQGFRSDLEFDRARAALLSLPVLPMLGSTMAVAAAQRFRDLRKRGVTVRKTIDVLIASFCIEHGHQLLYSDRDFDPFVQHLGLEAA